MDKLKLAWFTVRSDIADLAVRLVGPRVREQTVASVPDPPGIIVDLLTGTGSVLLEYAKAFPGARIIAVDSNEKILEVAKGRLSAAGFTDVKTLAADAGDVPLDACIADVVNISFGLHELRSLARGVVLEESCRLLKPGGSLVVTDYREVRGMLRGALARVYFLLFEPRWIREIFNGGLERQVEATGLEIKRVRIDLPFTRLIVARKSA